MEPKIQYARTADGVSIAYWTMGEGLPFLELQIPFSNIEREAREWEWHRLVARDRMVIRYDNRGAGSSQRDVSDFSLAVLLMDVEAVVERLGFEQLVVYGELFSAPVAVAYAAQHPERVSHLILVGAFADPAAMFSVPRMKTLVSMLDHGDWEAYTDALALHFFGWDQPSAARDMSAFYQACMTREQCAAFMTAAAQHDVTALLPQVRAPTLVLHPTSSTIPPVESTRALAAGISGSKYSVIESPSPWSDELTEALLIALDEFLGDGDRATLAERLHKPAIATRSSLVTILFTDIVGSTPLMHALGDARWRELLSEHERITREILGRYGGAEVKTIGDSFMASFDSASRTVECAIELQRAFAARNAEQPEHSVHVRIGLNAGEPIPDNNDLFGTTVTLASRIMGQANGGEILVANVVRELCAGKGLLFADRGETVLRGFEDPVRLYEVRWQGLD